MLAASLLALPADAQHVLLFALLPLVDYRSSGSATSKCCAAESTSF
jgi:hypothetical protein